MSSGCFSHYLREVESLRRYRVLDAAGGDLGHVAGLLFDPSNWSVDHLVVNGQAGRQLVLATREVRAIDDATQCIAVAEAATAPKPAAPAAGSMAVAEASGGDSRNLVGRDVYGLDERAGRVIDLLVNVNVWQLRYLVIETSGRRVLTDIEWCVSLGDRHAPPRIDLPSQAIATAPLYTKLGEFCRGDEEALYRHYTQRACVEHAPA